MVQVCLVTSRWKQQPGETPTRTWGKSFSAGKALVASSLGGQRSTVQSSRFSVQGTLKPVVNIHKRGLPLFVSTHLPVAVRSAVRRNEIDALMAKYVGQEHTMYLKICYLDVDGFFKAMPDYRTILI